jgi:hypothetical protein
MNEEFSSEELTVSCRQRAETALQAAAERVSDSPRSDTDQATIALDWEVPLQAHAPIPFEIRIGRRGRESSICFVIDLNQLETGDLQTLHDSLAYPPRGYWLARAVAWLLDISLQQRQPSLSGEERAREVRQLLLARRYEPS